MALNPLFLSPTLPSELLTYVATHAHHPTTLLICSPRAAFISNLVNDISHQIAPAPLPEEQYQQPPPSSAPTSSPPKATPQPKPDPDPDLDHRLMHAPLHLVARTRHIRTLFVPTVSHLRALLATFHTADSTVPPPPPQFPQDAGFSPTSKSPSPLLLVHGLLEIHRDTSEWSAQGLGSTTAGLVEAAVRVGMRPVVVEPKAEGRERLEEVLAEAVPLLSVTARRVVDGDESGLSGRTAEVGRVLERWFEFESAKWESGVVKSVGGDKGQ